MHEKYLQELGLSDKEAKIYLTLLSIEAIGVAELAEKTKIKRPTAYVILKSLLEKGLVSEVPQGKKILYSGEAPERLRTFAEKRKTYFEENIRRLDSIIPELKATVHESGSRPIVKYFEGKEGVTSILEEFYTVKDPIPNEEMCLIYSRDLLYKHFTQEEIEVFKKQRVGHSIFSKGILNDSNAVAKKLSPSAIRVLLETDKYPIKCDIGVFRDRVRITMYGEKISGIYIQSKDFADTMKTLVQKIIDKEK